MDPMLLRNWDYDDPTGWWVSEKLDGIRAIWDGNTLRTRQGVRVPCPAWFTDNLPQTPLDGELWTKRGDLDGMRSIFSTGEKGDWESVKFVVFDIPNGEQVEDRIRCAMDHPDHVVHTLCRGMAHLEDMLNDVAELGGEGLVLRAPGSLYEHKRSGNCRKLRLASLTA